MTRTSRGSELNFDSEIEKTAQELKKTTKQQKLLHPLHHKQTQLLICQNFFEEPEIIAEPEPTLRRMANPDVNQ